MPSITTDMINPKEFKCLQIILQHCSTAAASLSQLILELDLDIVLIQEPYVMSTKDSFPNLPPGYSVSTLSMLIMLMVQPSSLKLT